MSARIPDKIHLLRGNPGKRKRDPEKGNALENKMPRCPMEMGKDAKKEWKRITRILSELDIIKEVDLAVLAGYCQAYAVFLESERLLNSEGYIITTEKGNVIQSPAVGIANQARDSMRKYIAELGFSPASRERVTYPKKEKRNALKDILNG